MAGDHSVEGGSGLDAASRLCPSSLCRIRKEDRFSHDETFADEKGGNTRAQSHSVRCGCVARNESLFRIKFLAGRAFTKS
jgi:hypothetical protein